jgi:Spy/CpxP family protein refolding chaperone
MKKLITLFAGVVLASSLAFGQAAGPKGSGVQGGDKQQHGQRDGKGRGPMRGKVLKQLDLTKEQQKQVREILLKFRGNQKPGDSSGAKPDPKEMKAKHEQLMAEVEKILTPEQKEKLKKIQAEAKGKIKDRAKGGKRGGAATGKGGGTTGAGSKTGGGGGL